MSEQTPSQAEGEREDDPVRGQNFPRTTPSQAEGEREEEPEPVRKETAAPDRRGPDERGPGRHGPGS
ncbi:hypothetical protein ABZ070_20555 [Streptomyces sp. NPDC006283]|uniref:hypothetical protein n=1 Tax=Streptomyces sp. NPDC006283 TaxID=3156741 RepID=UPI0033A19516